MILAFALGVLTWSFLEYTIHRWLGHDRRFVRRTPFGVEHTAHHSRGNYFAAWWKKALAALLAIAIVAPLAVLIGGAGPGAMYTTGFVGFYLAYEVLHRLMHVWRGVGPYARWARRHHFFHHFHDPRLNHGVTSPIWDLAFGTYRRPERIAVPRKLAMRWLVDPATDAVRSDVSRDYQLRG